MTVSGFESLQAHYRDPLAAAKLARRSGVGVVGLIGETAPVELVLAAGLMPVRICAPSGGATPTADHYMDDIIAPDAKLLFESAVSGDFEFLALLVLTRSEDKLFYFLKEMVRLGRAPSTPPLHMFDLMGSQREAVRRYNLENFQWLRRAIERIVGHEIDAQSIRSAIELTNRARELQRQLMQLRWSGLVQGSDAMQAIGASYFMHPQDYAVALKDYLKQLSAQSPVCKTGPRLLIATAEPLSHLTLHQRIERAGGFVVAEDDAWGARAPGADVSVAMDGAEALFEKYWLDVAHSQVYPPEAREAWLLEHLPRADLDGIIFYVPPSDRQFGWDYPRLARHAESVHKPSLLLRQDAKNDDAVDAPIAEFIKGLRTAGAQA